MLRYLPLHGGPTGKCQYHRWGERKRNMAIPNLKKYNININISQFVKTFNVYCIFCQGKNVMEELHFEDRRSFSVPYFSPFFPGGYYLYLIASSSMITSRPGRWRTITYSPPGTSLNTKCPRSSICARWNGFSFCLSPSVANGPGAICRSAFIPSKAPILSLALLLVRMPINIELP